MYDYLKLDKKVDSIVDTASLYMTSFNKEYIKQEIFKAYLYSRDAHEGQMRYSGEPYITHPVESTLILLHLKPDIYTIQSCLLHDVIEDTPKTNQDIEENFGNEVAFLCSGMEKLSKVKYIGEDRNIGNLRKTFIAMAEDLRVIFVRLSDRLHNMRTMKYISNKYKKERISLETLNIYVPIADRLGLFYLKNSLERECFKVLKPKDYKDLEKKLIKFNNSGSFFMLNAEKEVKNIISEQVSNYEVDLRIKSIYSIYRKMKIKGVDNINSLYDFFGIRIMVNDLSDCYKVLGIIHNKWAPIPKRLKDYIALPKPNGYQSLHTTVIGLLKDHREQPTEIQIKTYAMKEYADIGVAAHFEYKEKGSKIAKDIAWVKELKDITENLETSDFISSLKIDVFKNRIFVFTPKGKSIDLPAGSTAIDFAYQIHTDIGDHISIAKINSKIYSLDKELHNGDIVEVITDNSKKPNPFWLPFLKTTKAKNSIKNYFKKENKELHRDRGREIMNKYLSKAGFDILNKKLSLLGVLDSKENTMEERLGILEQIGSFGITPSSVLRRIMRSGNIKTGKNTNNLGLNNSKKSTSRKTEYKKGKIMIGGEKNIPYKLCTCCNGEISPQIIAHINSKSEITVHKKNCKILNSVNKDRLLSAYAIGYEEDFISLKINFVFSNERGILKELNDIIYSMEITIEEVISKKPDFGDTRKIGFTLNIPEHDYLAIEKFIEKVKINLKEKLIDYNIKEIK